MGLRRIWWAASVLLGLAGAAAGIHLYLRGTIGVTVHDGAVQS